LIADEVQTGAGRTGTFFAMEQMGVAADITTFAKSIAGGFPLSGITGKAEVMDAVTAGGLGGTYGGSPIACAAALAVIEVFEEEQLLARANDVGAMLKSVLGDMQAKYPQIAEVRGLGAMIAVELMEDGEPAPQYSAKILAEARNRGLILLSCGTYGNVIRVLVPLTAPDEQIHAGLAIMDATFNSVFN
jgi:4-aminobutyrate aminotransferase/(S)-3-amino-2-methylpropionate transaminase